MVHLEQAQPEQLQELLAFAEEAFRTPEGKVDALIELSPRRIFDQADVDAYVAEHNLREIARGAKLYLE
mgnify:CR=1 FL=1